MSPDSPNGVQGCSVRGGRQDANLECTSMIARLHRSNSGQPRPVRVTDCRAACLLGGNLMNLVGFTVVRL